MDRPRTRFLAWLALLLGVLAIIIFRAPEMVFMPSLLFDEGSRVFAFFYEHREPGQILRFKSGYLPLAGNLIGYLGVRLPTSVIPYWFVGSAVLISGFAYSLFFARGFRKWVPSDLDRALICLVLALAPISDCLLVTSSDYSLWNLLAALMLLTALPPATDKRWRLGHGLGCNLLVWTHPLAIVIAPLVLWRALKEVENRGFYRLLLFNLVVHQIFGVAGVVTTHGLWDHSTGVQFDTSFATKFLDSCRWTLGIIGATAFRTAFGDPQFDRMGMTQPAVLLAWILAVAVLSYFVARKIPRVRSLMLFLAYLIGSVTFLSCFLRHEDVQDDPLRFISDCPRYIYLQSLAWLVLFGTLVSGGWELVAQRLIAHPIGRQFQRFALLPLLALLCYYYLLNCQMGYSFFGKTKPTGRYYDRDPRNGPIVREFFSNLAKEEKARGSWRGIQLTAAKFNEWPITIDTTVSHSPMRLRLSRRARIMAILLGLIALGYLTRRWWLDWFLSKVRPQAQLPSP